MRLTLAASRFPVACLAAFVLLATMLPFAAVPGTGAVPLTLVPLAAFNASWLWQVVFVQRRVPRGAASCLALTVIAVAATAFTFGVARFGYAPDVLLVFGNLVLSLGLLAGIPLVLREPGALRQLYRLLMVGAASAAFLGLLLWALPAATAERLLVALAPIGYPDGPELVRVVYGTQLERATGTSVDPNLFGGLLLIGGALVSAQLLSREPLWPKRVLLLAGVLILAALVVTFSRSAWVGFGVALCYLGVTVDRRALLVLALGAVLALVVPQLRDRMAGALLVQDEASVLRVEEYRASLALIAEHPWLGVGFGEATGLNLVRRVSNMYMLMAEQIGIPGLTCLLVLFGVVARRLLPRRRSPPDLLVKSSLAPGLAAAFLGCLVVGLFDHYFLNTLFPHTGGMFFLIAGLTLVAHEPMASPPARARSTRHRSG